MVQSYGAIDLEGSEYDRKMEDRRVDEPDQPDWTDLIRRTVQELAGAVSESSKQLGSAAERFAGQSLAWVDQMTARVQQSAALSQEMAEVANRAADEARRAVENLQHALAAASERVQAEARDFFQQASERVAAEADQAAEKIGRAADAASERLNSESRRLLEELSTQIEQSLAASREAAERAARAAQEAQQAARKVADAGSLPSVTILDRLEADYHLLNQLVQDLHARLAGLAGSHPHEEAASVQADDATGASVPGEGERVGDEAVVAAPSDTTVSAAPPTGDEPAAPRLEGRIQLTIAPVPDFDRLLNLDAALGRVNGVRSVTLADFAREEVVFRVEFEATVPLADLLEQLGAAAHQRFEVVAFEPGGVSLRLVPAA